MKKDNEQPWESGKALSTEKKYVAWIRGALRKAWTRYPTQNEFKNSFKVKSVVLDEEGKEVIYKSGKKKGQVKTRFECPCHRCGGIFPAGKVQVDHVESAGATPNAESLSDFMFNLFCGQGNMQLLCIDCHAIKSHADRYNLTFEQAALEKDVIAFKNLKAAQQKERLKELGLAVGSNANTRVNTYREWVLKGGE